MLMERGRGTEMNREVSSTALTNRTDRRIGYDGDDLLEVFGDGRPLRAEHRQRSVVPHRGDLLFALFVHETGGSHPLLCPAEQVEGGVVCPGTPRRRGS